MTNVNGRTLYVVAVASSEQSISAIQHAVSSLPGAQIDFPSDRIADLDPRFFARPAPDIVFIEVTMGDPVEMKILADVVRDMPNRTSILVTAEGANLDDVRYLMRLGVADFVPQPITRSDLMSALEAAVMRITPGHGSRPTGKVYTVLGAGGGVGATTMAIQTAADFLIDRKEPSPHVAFLDFDLQFGTAALSLDTDMGSGLLRVVEEIGHLDAAFLRSAMIRHRSGLDILASPDTIVPLDVMTPEIAEQIISVARDEYDYVIVDLPGVWTNWTLSVLGASDLVLMVTNLSLAGLERARRQFQAMTEQGLAAVPSVVVVNSVDGDWSNRKRLKEAESILGRKIDYCVRHDPKSARLAAERGLLVQEVRRKSRIEKDIHKILEGANDRSQKGFTPEIVPDQFVPAT